MADEAVMGATRVRAFVPHRWRAIDAIRGFAIAGILFVNLPSLLREGAGPIPAPVVGVYEAVVTGRFYVIFSFLFGVSAALLYASSQNRLGRAPARWLMVRRYLFLLPIALIHALVLSPIDVLLPYAICAIVLLIPAMFLPRSVALVVGLVMTILGDAVLGVGYGAVPGLLLTGWGAAQFGLPQALESAGRRTAILFVCSVVVGAGLTAWQLSIPGSPDGITPGFEYLAVVAAFAGCAVALAYVCGFSLLWRTRARAILSAVFDPLGRMALTNYMAASLFFLLWGIVWPGSISGFLYPIVTVLFIAAQSVLSRLWLRAFTYGPVEWVWRVATRWEFTALRRPRATGGTGAAAY